MILALPAAIQSAANQANILQEMSTSPLPLSNEQARGLIMNLQGLCAPPASKLKRDGLYDLIEQMGFVQLDTINTVERAHHQILFSRNQTYRKQDLKDLLEKDRLLFENWTHDASIIPTEYYPYWKHRFDRARKRFRHRDWLKKKMKQPQKILKEVRGRIEKEGPLMSRDFETDEKHKSESWWGWKPHKAGLEYLWHTGELAVTRRDGFQKVYDFAERVIPEEHYEPSHSKAAFIDWACRSALEKLGVGTSGEIARFWDIISPAEAAKWCKQNSGKHCIPVTTECCAGDTKQAFARPDIEDTLCDLAAPPTRLRFLSPFDPVIRDRQRLERFFGFDYRIEIFVPEAKRVYGYYVLPILEGNRFVGRIDLKAYRNEDRLGVLGLWLEPKIKMSKARKAAINSELERLRKFAGVGRVEPGI